MKFKKTDLSDEELEEQFLVESFFDSLPVIGYVDEERGVTVLPASERDEEEDDYWEAFCSEIRDTRTRKDS